ncbi:MAG: beta strand repeat-containing protein [Myxococcota bacterium]
MRLLALAALFVSTFAAAQVSGTLGTGTTTWAGNVSLIGDVTVPVGGTLVIQPGTVVTAATTDSQGSGDLPTKPELIVLGTLNISGVNGGGVTLTGAGTGNAAWGGIVLRGGAQATISYLTMDESQNGITVALNATATTLTMSDSTLTGNTYGVYVGGGSGSANVTLTNVALTNNISRGLEMTGGTVQLTGSSISGVTQTNAVQQSGGTLTLTSSLVVNNTYGAYLTGGTATFDRCTVSGNGTSSVTTPGIETWMSSGTTTIISSVISHNSGRGVQRSNAGTINLTYSNVWGNQRSWGTPPTASANTDNANVNGTNSVVYGNTSNNKSENPLFVDFAGRNYRLTSNSGSRFSGASNADQGALPYVSDATVGTQGTLWTSTTLSGNVSVVGDLTVPPGVTLTLAPGTVLSFATNDSVGGGSAANRADLLVRGTLTAVGTSGSAITLTGAGGTGTWGGVWVRPNASVTFANATIEEAFDGVLAELGNPGTSLTISNSAVQNNTYGVYVGGGSGSANVTLTNVTVANNTNRGLEMTGGTVQLTGSSISGVTQTNALLQSGGTLTLTSSLVVNNTYGAYLTGGTATFDRCTVSGNGTTSVTTPGIETWMSSGTTTIISSVISHNSGRGVQRSNAGTINLTYSNVWGNQRSWGTPPTASANTDNANVNGTNSVVYGNTSNNKSENPLFVDFAGRNYRLTSNSGSRFSGATGVDQGALPYVSDATVGTQGTLWTSTTLSGNVSVLGDLTVAPGVTLTLAPGAVLSFATNDSVGGGSAANRADLLVRGTLTAVGTSGSQISLTGAGGTGTWGGVWVRPNGSASFANAIIEEAYDGVLTELGSSGSTLSLSNSTVQNNTYGVYVGGGSGSANVTLNQVTLANNTNRGLEVTGGTVSLVASSLRGTTQTNAVLQSGGSLSLERTLIANNTYGVYLTGGTASFDRCTVSGNGTSSVTTPGIETWMSSGTTTIISSIISHNSGRGVQRSNAGTINLTYSNVWGNQRSWGPPPTAAANTDNANVNGTNSVVVGNTSNNKSENPLFVDFATSNFALQVGSPSRMAGLNGVDQGAFPYTVGTVASVSISPATATVNAGGIIGFAAQARDAMGNIVQNEPFTWTATPAAGTISSSGVLTAGCTPGTYTAAISARTANGTTGTASVTITIGPATQLVIAPSMAQVKSQATQQYTATVRDACGNTIPGQTIGWSSNTTAGSITSGGLFTASCQRGVYASGITASAGSLTQSTQVEVVAGDPVAVAVTPMTVTVPAGTTQQFAASVADGCGNTVPGAVTWSTSVPGATISATGLFTAGQNNGTFATGVTATAGSRTGNASVTVSGGSGGMVASVTVTPSTVTLSPGATQTFTATARDSGGNVITGMSTTWAASMGGSITSGGVFTAGNTAGTFTDVISATIGGVTGRASVTITPGPVATVTVAPATVTLAPGGQATFTATGRDAFNNPVSGTVTWSATPAVGTITQSGVLTATTSPGTYPASVTATMGAVSGTASVTVQTGALSSLTVAPAATAVQAGGTVAFSATGRDANGNTVPVTPTWSVVAGGGSIAASGIFTAGTTSGTFANTVRAEANGLTAFASVNVMPGPVLSVSVTPSTATVMAGGTQQFTAEARDAFNNAVPTAFTWASTPAAGTITQGGFFTAGTSPGSFPNGISAVAGSITGYASVSVTPSGTGGGGGMTGGGGGMTGGGGGSMTGGGGGETDAGTGGGGGGDVDGGTGGGMGTGGGGGATGGGMGQTGGGGGGGTAPSGCSCSEVDALSVVGAAVLGLLRRRRR